MSKKTNRFMELEGLRGLAAVVVVLTHFFYLFYPALRNGDMKLAHTRFEDNLYGSPFMFLLGGTLAVAVFFVLSGFVLSIGYFKTHDENIIKKLATGRYLRLMLPALASVLIAFLLISFGAHQLTKNAGDIAASKELSLKWRPEVAPNLFEAVKLGTLDIFIEKEKIPVNGPLWTMYIEFLGSFLVFGFLALFAKSKYRWIVYLLLTIATFKTWFLAFVIGMMIADAYNQGLLEKLKRKRVIIPMAILALFFGLFPKHSSGTVYKYFEFPFQIKERVFFLTISATLILLVVLLSRRLNAWLQKPKISPLGKYTFSLYLTHVFVIYTVSSAVVIGLHEAIGYNQSVLVAALVSIPVFWVVTVIFERYIDAPSIKLARYVGAIYRGEREVSWTKNIQKIKRKVKRIVKPRTRQPRPELDEGVD